MGGSTITRDSTPLGDNLFGVWRSRRECVKVRARGAAQSAWWSGMAGIVSRAERANVHVTAVTTLVRAGAYYRVLCRLSVATDRMPQFR